MPSDPRAQPLPALSRFLVTTTSVGDTLFRVIEITAGAITRTSPPPSVGGCSPFLAQVELGYSTTVRSQTAWPHPTQ